MGGWDVVGWGGGVVLGQGRGRVAFGCVGLGWGD